MWTFRLDTGETILAMLKGDKVESLQFNDPVGPAKLRSGHHRASRWAT